MPILGDNEYDPAPGASYKFGAPNQIWRPQPNLAPQKVKKCLTTILKKFIKNKHLSKIRKKIRIFFKILENFIKNTKMLQKIIKTMAILQICLKKCKIFAKIHKKI